MGFIESLKNFFQIKVPKEKRRKFTKKSWRTRVKANYLIEFRFHGYTKKYANKLSKKISRKFHVKRIVRKGKPPHISLYGGFTTNNEKEMISKFVRVCKKYNFVKFWIKGVSHIDNRVVQLDIRPSEELKQLREELATELNKCCEASPWDKPGDFIFHATLAFKDIEQKFDKIWKFLKYQKKPSMEQYLLRVTLLKNRKILKEYDLIQRRLLNRKQALSKKVMKKTFDILKDSKKENGKRKITVLNHFVGKAFFISDTHFDHKNIIKYTNRPFKNVKQMNETMVKNWNRQVGERDTVYFLGDMSFGKGSRKASYWLKQLNGRIVFIEGNHEETGNVKAYTSSENVFLNYKGKEFLLIHDPNLNTDWKGWKIHGHIHNNDPENYPFINKEKKTINISAELINYTPIEIEEILSLIP